MSEYLDTPKINEPPQENLPRLNEEANRFLNSRPLRPILNSLNMALTLHPAKMASKKEDANRERDLKRFMASLTTLDVGALGSDETDQQCPVCFEKYIHPSDEENPSLNIMNETPVRLPCSHLMGKDCLESWLANADSCPSCRTQVFKRENTNGNNAPAGNDSSDDEINSLLMEARLLCLICGANAYLETHPPEETLGAWRVWMVAQPARHNENVYTEVFIRRARESMFDWLENFMLLVHGVRTQTTAD